MRSAKRFIMFALAAGLVVPAAAGAADTKSQLDDGKDLGKIKEVWVDPKNGQAKEVVVSTGATLGVGGKDKVLSWNDLTIAWKDQKLFVSADPNALRDAYESKMDREDRGPAASPATKPKP